jgi:hypothetical protein
MKTVNFQYTNQIGLIMLQILQNWEHMLHSNKTMGTQKYLMSSLTKVQRSHIAQLRCGIVPLKLKTGRYVRVRIDERICSLCTDNVVDDETHFFIEIL